MTKWMNRHKGRNKKMRQDKEEKKTGFKQTYIMRREI